MSLENLDGGDLVVMPDFEAAILDGLVVFVFESMVERLGVVVEGAMVERRSLVGVGRVADDLAVVEDPRDDIRLETPLPTPVFFSSPEVTEASVGASDVVRGPKPTLFAVVEEIGRVGGLLSVLPATERVDEAEVGFGVEPILVLAPVELLCEAAGPAAGLRGAAEVESVLESTPRRAAGVLAESDMIQRWHMGNCMTMSGGAMGDARYILYETAESGNATNASLPDSLIGRHAHALQRAAATRRA